MDLVKKGGQRRESFGWRILFGGRGGEERSIEKRERKIEDKNEKNKRSKKVKKKSFRKLR